MYEDDYSDIGLYIGVVLILGMFLTLFTIIATYTAWGTVLPVSDSNVQAIFRSKVGLHVLSLPNKLATASIYCYLTWLTMLLWKILPVYWGAVITGLVASLYLYLNYINSGLSRVIMNAKAMPEEPIFSDEELRAMHPDDYDKALIAKVSSMARHRVKTSSSPLFASMTADEVRNQYSYDSSDDDDDDNNNVEEV